MIVYKVILCLAEREEMGWAGLVDPHSSCNWDNAKGNVCLILPGVTEISISCLSLTLPRLSQAFCLSLL